MGLYSSSAHIQSDSDIANSDQLMEMLLAEDILRGTDEEIKTFCESSEAKILVEKNMLKKNTLMRISKKDDLKRRTKLIAYRLAKEAKDPLWTKLVKYHTLKKEMASKILEKYGAKAERIAKEAQKAYLKKTASVKATAAEQKAMNAQ